MLKRIIKYCLLVCFLLFAAYYIFKYFMAPPTRSNCLRAQGKTATIFLIDGLENEHFKKLLDAGKLPFIRNMIDGGIYVKDGISSFPTMTGYGYFPLISGIDAVNSGILGLRWFDRSRTTGNLRNYVGRTNIWMNKDIDTMYQNAFQLSQDTFSASINSFMNKGVKEAVITGWYHSAAKFEGLSIFNYIRKIPIVGHEIAMDHFQHESNAVKIAMQQLACNPKLHFITLPSPDASNHVHGFTKQYEDLLVYIDGLMATYWDEVKKQGEASNRILVLASDHGVEEVEKNLDLRNNFANLNLKMERGNAVNIKSMELSEDISSLSNLDAYFVINGNLSAYIYFKGDENWKKNLPYGRLENYTLPDGKRINLLQHLAVIEGINWCAANKDENQIIIYNSNGYSIITKKDSVYTYEAGNADVFGYADFALDNKAMTRQEWLQSTIGFEYPYAVPRLYDLLKAKEFGDLIITSKPGYDLGQDYERVVGNYKGGHGALRRQLLVVPFIFYNPILVHKEIPTALSEDVGATIINWLELEQGRNLDGKNLLIPN